MANGRNLALPIVAVAALIVSAVDAAEPAGDPAALEFFEKEVRPLFVARCQSCHGAKTQKGHLRLDSGASVLAGGESGPAVVPGKPAESLLIDAINYGELYQMPPKSKLPAAEIATLTRWVEMGAPWPQHDEPRPTASVPTFDLRKRAEHWSFRPMRVEAPPASHAQGWPRTVVDRYILAGLEAQGLKPAPEANRRTLIRRLTFDLTGLPPTPDEVEAFIADSSPAAYERLAERLLASPLYGERWGRHWLDLVRYAETAGHEFDYEIADAYRYRDYVIRAFNADLPYNQLVIEHLAGDLLEHPRRHPVEGFNESILGTGFFFLGEGTHSPVDLLEDEAMRVDNQIDVLSKAFLGLTVACARCHDHKFDPISTRDYYALYGYFQSSRHQHAFIDPPGRIGSRVAELEQLKNELRPLLGLPTPADAPRNGDERSVLFEDFNGPSYRNWSATGDAFGQGPSRPGEFRLTPEKDRILAWPVAAGQAHSGLVSARLQGVLRSRTFVIEKRFIHYLASGISGRVNLVIDGLEKIRSPIYGGLTLAIANEHPRWYAQDVGMWLGHRAYIELADGAMADFSQSGGRYWDGSGYLAVDEIRFSDQATLSAPSARAVDPVDPAKIDDPRLASLVSRYREVEAAIPPPTLALAITEGTGEDEPVHIRGGTRTLGEVVPRRFLEAIAGPDQPAPTAGSGRLELARRMVDPANPLLARVMINRIWAHHFGRGIVASPDDFGVMGRPPTHPALLDALAARFIADGWSVKAMHRLIVLSSTYRMNSRPDPEADRLDPDNQWLHRMNVRRLEAEAIRDTLLAVSGRLDSRMYGPSVAPFLTPFMDGRGRPTRSGPIDGDGRRSLYLNVRRNFLNPMFLAFDFPSPFSTMGRRNVSNVPAQALTMLNDPFVVGQARVWSDRLRAEMAGRPRRDVVERMYRAAFGRPPTDEETAEALAFLGPESPGDPELWADLCHVLFNVKELIYVN